MSETDSAVPTERDDADAAKAGSGPVPSRILKGRGLPRGARLVRETEFAEAFDAKETLAARRVVVWIRRGNGAGRRVGVVASKRTFHLAVERNRAKRLMREAFRMLRGQLADGVDVVLLGRRKLLESKRDDVERDLLYAWRKLGVLLKEES